MLRKRKWSSYARIASSAALAARGIIRGRGRNRRSSMYPTPPSTGRSRRIGIGKRRRTGRSYNERMNARIREEMQSVIGGNETYFKMRFSRHKLNTKQVRMLAPTQTFHQSESDKLFSALNTYSEKEFDMGIGQDLSSLSVGVRNQVLATTGGSATSIPQNIKFLLTTGYMHITVSSSLAYPQIIEFYNVKCKRDCVSTMLSIMTNELGPLNSNKIALSTTAAIGQNWITPFMIPQAMLHWRVIKKTRIILAPGQMHVHKISFNWNKMYNTGMLNNTDEGANTCYRGYTGGCYVRALGAPVLDSGATGNSNYGQTSVAIMVEKRYNVRGLPIEQRHVDYFKNELPFVGQPEFMGVNLDEAIENTVGVLAGLTAM